MTFFNREPALWLGFIQAGLALAVGFGLPMTQEQFALLMAFSVAFFALVTRSQVTPTSKLR